MNDEIISRESIENGGDAEIITLNILGECRLIGRTSDGVHILSRRRPWQYIYYSIFMPFC